MILKEYIFSLLFSIFTLVGFSQITQNIKGVLIDSQSEFPLDAASVIAIVEGKKYGAITNFDGEFNITNVPLGKVDITAFYTGYHTQSFMQLNLISGKELVVNFVLLEKLESLNEVVITAKTKRESVTFITTSAASFNVEQTNKYAGSLNDVSRMAMNYAGVNGSDDSRNEIIVRGNNPSSLLWMIEGASVPSPNHYSSSGASGGPVSMLNINTLSKSDFLSGAFSSNFGNTTSAAFDLQFRKPNNQKTEFVGQIGFAGAEFGIEGPFSKENKASYLLNYRYSTLALFDAIGVNLGLGTAIPKYQDINAIINIPTKKVGGFKIWTISGVSNIKFETGQDENDNLYVSTDDVQIVKNNKNSISGITHKYFFNKKTSSKISISYSNIDEFVDVDEFNTLTNQLEKIFDLKIINKQTNIDAKINSKISAKNKVSFGVNYTNFGTNLTINSYNLNWRNKLNNNTGLAAFYTSWQYRFSNNVLLNTGLRFAYFTLNNQGSLEPRIGLKYKLKSKTNLSIAYGLHSNIHPLLTYFTTQEVLPGNFQYKNTNLGFMKSHHFITGITHKLKNRIKLKAEIYYQFLFDVPISHKNKWYSIINSGFGEDGGAQIQFDALYNEGKGRNYGLDLTMEYPLKNNFYALLTGSLYNSTYLAYDNKWRSTAWNGNFMMSLLAGKEFKINNKSTIGTDINLNYAGGRRTAPIDIAQSIANNETVYDEDRIFESKLTNYFRTDIKLSYKRNGKKISQEWNVDLRNTFNTRNVFSKSYNTTTNSINTKYQTGFLPVVQYRILF